MTSSLFKPNGRSHRVLSRLSEGPASFGELQDVAKYRCNSDRSKAWHLLTALIRAGFVVNTGRQYAITPSGMEALSDLREGFSVSSETARPSVRVFARGEAA